MKDFFVQGPYYLLSFAGCLYFYEPNQLGNVSQDLIENNAQNGREKYVTETSKHEFSNVSAHRSFVRVDLPSVRVDLPSVRDQLSFYHTSM
jgi:hypothetical protein